MKSVFRVVLVLPLLPCCCGMFFKFIKARSSLGLRAKFKKNRGFGFDNIPPHNEESFAGECRLVLPLLF